MSLIRKLEDEEWDIVSIVTDPILFGEFLRNTADGSPVKEEWPKRKFGYRWYQKDLLTDKSEFISLVAGRAVGKCSPLHSRIYTYPYGYVSIRDIVGLSNAYKINNATVYAIDPKTKELVQAKLKVTKNGAAPRMVYKVTTNQGHVFAGTANHPILTQRGYIAIEDLDENDRAAVPTRLPHESNKNEFSWEELRWLGYAASGKRVNPEMTYKLKFQRNILEFQRIADVFDVTMRRLPDGTYQLMRKRGPLKHYISMFMKELHLSNYRTSGLLRVPARVKSERIENIMYFLEAFFSANGEFTADDIKLHHHNRTFAYDIQELLLRWGIESRVSKVDDTEWLVHINDYNSYYTFFQEFDVPGVTAKNLRLPTFAEKPESFIRFDAITSIEETYPQYTWAVTVRGPENYISDNVFVHNSLVLEDKIIYEAINVDDAFPVTKESLLVTANVSQMTPILDRLIMRLGSSVLLKDFLKGQINRSKGTLDFPQPGGTNYRINARIAGSNGESNMIGMHTPRIIGDEMSVFPMAAFTQLEPALNTWEPNVQEFFCGVNY